MLHRIWTTLVSWLFMYFYLRKAKLEILKNSKTDIEVIVLRDLLEQIIRSPQLVPGDIMLVKTGMKMPCDCVLLEGEILLNEASMTGESDPITKFPLETSEELFSYSKQNRSILLEGTTVVAAEERVRALVIRTGFHSMKGTTVRGVVGFLVR